MASVCSDHPAYRSMRGLDTDSVVCEKELTGTMNDPQVVALIYTVEHGNSVDYDNAGSLRYSESPEFDLTVDDYIARFEFKEFYADEDAAREAIEPFIQHWEFEASMRFGPGNFSLRFREPEIIDRNPSPAEPDTKGSGVVVHFPGVTITTTGSVVLGFPHYPPPPACGSVDLDDPCVVKMKRRYGEYRLGRAKLPDMAYFCMTVLKEKYGSFSEAARKCGVSRNVLVKIRSLSSTKGGEDARKAAGTDREFTNEEKRFLQEAVEEIIIRAAQVAADDSQRHPPITMADLPIL